MRSCSRKRRLLHVAAVLASCGIFLGLAGCGQAPKDAAPPGNEAAPAPKPKAVDAARYLPRDGQVSAQFLEDGILGIPSLPGGNIGEYKSGGKSYRQFLVKAPSAALAAVYLSDVKDAMSNPRFVASFGGYFGELNGEPAFVFTKNEYLTGFLGLPLKEADAAGRVAASRIP